MSQLSLQLRHELVVDSFAGGGGASTGIEAALGRSVDIAINHDGEAIAMHRANHPHSRHLCSDVFEVDPVTVTRGQPVGLAWFSPDCKHFSKAKGGKPVEKKIRGLAWVVIRWAATVKPRVIMLENVEEFQDWGPLTDEGRPCPERKGLTFRRWKKQLENHGYKVECRELRACDYGAPTTRDEIHEKVLPHAQNTSVTRALNTLMNAGRIQKLKAYRMGRHGAKQHLWMYIDPQRSFL